jgi:hypothetical protein
MSQNEYEPEAFMNRYQILKSSLETLQTIEVMYDDYESIGRLMVARRYLAELLNENLQDYALPGESTLPEDKDDIACHFIDTSFNHHTDKYTQSQIMIVKNLMMIIRKIGGMSDSDDACLRCAVRMLAETLPEEDLSKYRLLYEKEVKNLYYLPQKVN